MPHPILSVILPVYNGSSTLLEAIDSILSQSFSDFELIIINDGSIDGSAALIEQLDDPRIQFLQQSNHGLAATLNRGISIAKGVYIARQDQDDISFGSRFQEQVTFLNANPEVGMVGTNAEIWVDNERTDRTLTHPTDDASLKFSLLFDNCFVHSSVMIRRAALEKVGGYSEDSSRQPPEDYELWSRIMKEYKLANLPGNLVAYREVEGSMSRTGVSPFLPNLIKISAENIAWASGRPADSTEVATLSKLLHSDYKLTSNAAGLFAMKALLTQAALNIAESAGIFPQQLDNALAWRIKSLFYRYLNYRCGGLPQIMLNSRTGNYLKKIVKYGL